MKGLLIILSVTISVAFAFPSGPPESHPHPQDVQENEKFTSGLVDPDNDQLLKNAQEELSDGVNDESTPVRGKRLALIDNFVDNLINGHHHNYNGNCGGDWHWREGYWAHSTWHQPQWVWRQRNCWNQHHHHNGHVNYYPNHHHGHHGHHGHHYGGHHGGHYGGHHGK